MVLFNTNAGPVVAQDGTSPIARSGRLGDLIVSELHGRFYEQVFRGNTYSGGMTLTSISNVTFTTGTLGATCTPIIGVWNPPNSGVNLELLQAALGVTVTAATNTGGAPYVWATSVGNTAITTGSTPLNRKTLLLAGSQAKFYAGTALTALTNNLVVQHGSALGGGSAAAFSFVGTAVGQVTAYVPSSENLDGSIIVPPGGVAALLATTTPVAHSAVSMLLWQEIPVA